MNIIINREKTMSKRRFYSYKKKTEKISTLECKWQWLPSRLLAINQSVAESTLPARLSDASADNIVYY